MSLGIVEKVKEKGAFARSVEISTSRPKLRDLHAYEGRACFYNQPPKLLHEAASMTVICHLLSKSDAVT